MASRVAVAGRQALLLVVVASLLTGCALTNRMFRDRAAEERAAALLQLQLGVMRFADEYMLRVKEQVEAFQRATTDPDERLASQSWLVSQSTGAVTIAAGSNPEINTIDMLVFATLSRMVIEDRWVGEMYGGRAAGMLAVHRDLEARAWGQADALLSEAQIEELRSSIDAWHRANPLGRVVPFIHLEDFAFATRDARAGGASSGSIFSFLGIDPLSGLDPAVRELAQTRQLAERAVFYGQRVPVLISMETQRLAFQMAVTPESTQVLQAVGSLGSAAQSAGDLAQDLPGLVARERAAAIEQVSAVFDARQGELQQLVTEMRAALEAGGSTSDSVRETIATLDALVARFERPGSAADGPPRRPFDITEYTEALRELGVAAEQLKVLLGQAEGQAPALAALPEQASLRLTALVDHLYWRLVQLVLVLVAASVLGAVAYRALSARWRRPA
jgi:hypothetical protein